MTTTLTAAAVARLKPSDKRREVPDGGMRGLSLLIHPSGAKAWVMRYRRPGNTAAMAKLTLGTADVLGAESVEEPVIGGHLTLASARALAADVHRQRALGRDPAEDRMLARAASRPTEAGTFGDAVRRYIAEYARPKTRRWEQTARMLGLRPSDLETVTTRGSAAYQWREGSKPIPDGIAHRWRNRPVSTINGDDIHAVLDETERLGVPGLERRKGASELRRRTLAAVVSGCFKWMLKNRIIKADPCAGMYRPPPSAARERALSDDELRWFWRACGDIGEPFGSLFRILAITGQRRQEAAGMTRSELDGARWAIPGARTKNKRPHAIALPPLALDVIAGVKAIYGDAGYVFSTSGTRPISGFSKVKSRLDAAMLDLARREAADRGLDPAQIKIQDWRLHDLRRTAATGMQRAGADVHVIERTLNHFSGTFGGIVSTYQQHKFETEVRAAVEAWSKLLLSIVGELPPNVVPIRA